MNGQSCDGGNQRNDQSLLNSRCNAEKVWTKDRINVDVPRRGDRKVAVAYDLCHAGQDPPRGKEKATSSPRSSPKNERRGQRQNRCRDDQVVVLDGAGQEDEILRNIPPLLSGTKASNTVTAIASKAKRANLACFS